MNQPDETNQPTPDENAVVAPTHPLANMSRAERRRRGQRGPLLPSPVRDVVSRQQGITQNEVTRRYLEVERGLQNDAKEQDQ